MVSQTLVSANAGQHRCWKNSDGEEGRIALATIADSTVDLYRCRDGAVGLIRSGKCRYIAGTSFAKATDRSAVQVRTAMDVGLWSTVGWMISLLQNATLLMGSIFGVGLTVTRIESTVSQSLPPVKRRIL
jgi:hypothetical protein